MSIAELIMTGTERASKSTDWVADSLAKIGDNVTRVLREREQNRQAQEMLPFLQQSMQESMQLAQKGDTAAAYSNMMGVFASNPNLMNNPRALPFFELGLNGIKESATRYKQNQDYNQRQAYYNSVLAKKTGGGGGDNFNPETFLDNINNGGDILEVDETVNPEGVNPVVAGSLPGLRIPTEGIQTQRGMGMTPKSITAQAAATGLPAVTPTGTPQTREEIDAAAAAGLPVATPTTPTAPGIGAVRGVTPENALFPDLQTAPSPKNVLERFIRFEDKFAALPFEKQKAEMDNNSIIFPDQKMLADYKPSKGRGIIQLSPEASVGIPGLVGAVEIPDKYKQYIIGNVNINPSTGSRSYSLRKEVENDPEAKAALAWLQDWQNASIEVNSNPKLRDLLAKANNDALAIDIEPIGKGELDGQNMVELSVRGNPDTKIQVFKETADQIKVLRSQTGAANVHNAKFIRLKGEEPAAKTPAPTQGGLPATQFTTTAPQIPEEAMALQKIVEQGQAAKAKETEKSVDKRIQDIDNEIKTLSSGTKITSAAPYTMTGAMGPYAMSSGSSVQARSKTSEEAQADIQKITNLKTERELLFAKTEKAYNAAKSEGRVFQNADEVKSSKKKFPAGTIIYIGREPAKVK